MAPTDPTLFRLGDLFGTMDAVREAIRRLPDSVAVDFFESTDEYLVVVDLPGVDPEGATIRTANGTLSVEASRSNSIPDEATEIRQNRPHSIEFDLPLPDDVLLEESQATLSNGVLAVTIPRGHPGTQIPIEVQE